MDTQPCPNCPGRRTVDPPAHPAQVAHWDPDGAASICPADERSTSDDPDHWPHPRA